jgi:hemerythrin
MQRLSPWSSALSVRNAQLDEQHIVLIELATELIARLTSGLPHSATISDLLADFVESVRHHDALEEVVLISAGYAGGWLPGLGAAPSAIIHTGSADR